jgi:hypothetical protein
MNMNLKNLPQNPQGDVPHVLNNCPPMVCKFLYEPERNIKRMMLT